MTDKEARIFLALGVAPKYLSLLESNQASAKEQYERFIEYNNLELSEMLSKYSRRKLRQDIRL